MLSWRDLVNHSVTIQNHIKYDSFGNITSQTNASIKTRFGYTGREFDAETGLYYYRARYYDAVVGRFISEDPISFVAGDVNLYRYVFNSPVNDIDPLGLVKTGTCTKVEWYPLYQEVTKWCTDHKTRAQKCLQAMSPQELLENAAKFDSCAAARDAINNTCFGGGDKVHNEQADNARKGSRNCRDLLPPPLICSEPMPNPFPSPNRTPVPTPTPDSSPLSTPSWGDIPWLIFLILGELLNPFGQERRA